MSRAGGRGLSDGVVAEGLEPQTETRPKGSAQSAETDVASESRSKLCFESAEPQGGEATA